MNIEMKDRCKEYMAKNLPVLRKKVGLSQMELAAMIGISKRSIGAYECGDRTMCWDTFLALELFFLCQEKTGDWVYYNEVLSPDQLFQREECCEEKAAEQV